MNNTSAITTGGVAISTATLMPAVEWALGLIFHVPVRPAFHPSSQAPSLPVRMRR